MAPIGSYAAVMIAAILHLEEARIMLMTHDADDTIAFRGLLQFLPYRYVLAGVMILSAVLALATVRDALRRRLSTLATVAMLVPQQVLLLITAISAWCAVWLGVYADGARRSTSFIEVDQMPRGLFSILHLMALVVIALYLAHNNKRRH